MSGNEYEMMIRADMSRRGSAEGGSGGGESEVVVLKRRRLVSAAPLYAGLARLSFLLDATQPGATPDALFMAALLELVIGNHYHYDGGEQIAVAVILVFYLTRKLIYKILK